MGRAQFTGIRETRHELRQFTAGMFAEILGVGETVPDTHEHVRFITDGDVREFLGEWNEFLGGFGIRAKKIFANFAPNHAAL